MTLQQECPDTGRVWSQAGGGIKSLGDLSGMKLRNPGPGQSRQGAEVRSQGEQIKNPGLALLTKHTK